MPPFRPPLQLNVAPVASASNRYMEHLTGTLLYALPIALFSRTQWCPKMFWGGYR